MPNLYRILCTLLVILVIGGCSSGKKALQKGEYEKAVAQAINRLKSKPDHKKAQSTLDKAYRYALERHQSNIQAAKASNDLLKWETISANYERINYMCEEILACPACREVIPNPVKYDSELANANRNAAKARYTLGMEAMQFKETRIKAIEAHQHFLSARDFVPRFKDIEDQLNESLYYATLKVLIEPIPAPFRALNISHEFFENKITEYLHHHVINDYIRFYTPGEITALDIRTTDHTVQMEFDRFSLGNVFSNKTTREVSKDSVLISEQGKENVYGTVKATVTVHEKAITGGGLLDFKVLDNALDKVITQEKFPSDYTWAIQWATFNGDERALSDIDRALVSKVELPVPNPQWMFEEFTAPLYDQVIRKMREYYREF